MKWTTEPPTKPGWYWFQAPDWFPEPIIVNIDYDYSEPEPRPLQFHSNTPHYIGLMKIKNVPGKRAGPIKEPTND